MNISTLSGNESLGYVVAHSNCQWEIELQTRQNNRSEKREGIKMFVEAATSNNNTKAKIVKLWWNSNDARYHCFYPLLISENILNMVFVDMKHMLSLEELSLELPVDCSCIAWPDLSRLRVLHLHLGIISEGNWKLSSLLSHLTLESLKIEGSSPKSGFCSEDWIALGHLMSPSRCPKNIDIEISQTFRITSDAQVTNMNHSISQLIMEVIVFGSECHDNLGYCIAHSSCQWILTFYKGKHFKNLEAETTFGSDTKARVVELRGGKYTYNACVLILYPLVISAEALNALFTDMKQMLSLEALSLELPVDCSCIAWPDLSRLRVLNLGISGERNWKLSSLLPQLTLDDLYITGKSSLCLADIIAIGEILSPFRCPAHMYVNIENTLCI